MFLVGGYVRDFYLNRIQNDVDMDGDLGLGLHLQKGCISLSTKGMKRVSHSLSNLVPLRLKTPFVELEFIGARKESYRRESRKPMVEDGSLEDDQNMRFYDVLALLESIKTG